MWVLFEVQKAHKETWRYSTSSDPNEMKKGIISITKIKHSKYYIVFSNPSLWSVLRVFLWRFSSSSNDKYTCGKILTLETSIFRFLCSFPCMFYLFKVNDKFGTEYIKALYTLCKFEKRGSTRCVINSFHSFSLMDHRLNITIQIDR